MKARRKRIELRHNPKIKVKEENNFYFQHLWGKKIFVDAISKSLFLKLYSLNIDCPWRKTRFGSF